MPFFYVLKYIYNELSIILLWEDKMKEVINKVLKYIKNDIRCNYKAYIIFLLIVPWFFIRFNYYIYSPGSLIDLDGRIKVSEGRK